MAAISTPAQLATLQRLKSGKPVTDSEMSRLFVRNAGGGLLSPSLLQSGSPPPSYLDSGVTQPPPYQDGNVGAPTADPKGMATISPDSRANKGYGNLLGEAVDFGLNASGYGGLPGTNTISRGVRHGLPGVADGLISDSLGLLGTVGRTVDMARNVATSPDPSKTVARSVGGMMGATTGAAVGGAWGGYVGGKVGSALGAAVHNSFTDGGAGDALNTRSQESARDSAEESGYTRSETSAAAATDRGRESNTSVDPGLGSSGYGLSPGLSEMGQGGVRGQNPTLGDYSSLGQSVADMMSGQTSSSSDGDRGGKGDSPGPGGIGGVSGADMGKGSESW